MVSTGNGEFQELRFQMWAGWAPVRKSSGATLPNCGEACTGNPQLRKQSTDLIVVGNILLLEIKSGPAR